MQTTMTPKTTWRDSTVVDRYLSRQSTMVTVRMTAALKERLDDRVQLECATGRRMSLNELCVQALVSVLDQLDAADRQIAESAEQEGCCDTMSR
jgi:hypothetical protein